MNVLLPFYVKDTKYKNICSLCGKSIPAHSEAYWNKEQGWNYHKVCWEKTPDYKAHASTDAKASATRAGTSPPLFPAPQAYPTKGATLSGRGSILPNTHTLAGADEARFPKIEYPIPLTKQQVEQLAIDSIAKAKEITGEENVIFGTAIFQANIKAHDEQFQVAMSKLIAEAKAQEQANKLRMINNVRNRA